MSAAQTTNVRLSRNREYVIVSNNGQSTVLNANLFRYLFDIPYTRKDGTQISRNDIFEMKERAQARYEEKVRASAV